MTLIPRSRNNRHYHLGKTAANVLSVVDNALPALIRDQSLGSQTNWVLSLDVFFS